MKVAIIGDIHGNLVALDAVLDELRSEQINGLVCLGDLAAGGPQPAEAIDRVQSLGCPVLMGNGDAWMFGWEEPAEQPQEEPARQLHDIARWDHQQLSPQHLEYLKGLLPTLDLRLGEHGSALCFHGSPHSYFDIINAATPDEELDRMFTGYEAALLIGGHTHVQLFRRYRESIVLNPGSVGLPHGRIRSRSPIRIPARAEYAVVEYVGGRLSVDLRRAPFSLDELRQVTLGSGMPHAEWWLARWHAPVT